MRWPFRRHWPTNAAAWFAARRDTEDATREQAFQQWLAANPTNAEEYALCEIAWAVSGDAARQARSTTQRASQGTLHTRRFAIAALLITVVAGAGFWFRPAPWQSWATAPGEQRALVLEDGSRVMLNTRTHIEVRFERLHREVRLLEGEAYFEVAKDAARPFVVHTALGSARAVGTRFNVYLQRSRLAVTTAEGRVLVNGRDGAGVLVDAGNQAQIDTQTLRARLEPASTAALSWRSQRIEVEDLPLARVLQEFSRYTAVPIRAANDAIGALRVSAVLRTGDMDALRATLKGAFNLDIRQRGEELVVEP